MTRRTRRSSGALGWWLGFGIGAGLLAAAAMAAHSVITELFGTAVSALAGLALFVAWLAATGVLAARVFRAKARRDRINGYRTFHNRMGRIADNLDRRDNR